MAGGGIHYFKPLPQFIQYLAFCLFTVLHLAHVFKCFIFAPHLGQNASLSSTNTWHFGHRGTGWLSEFVGIIAPHSAQYKFLSRKNGSMNNNTKGIKNIIGASRIIYKIIRPTFRGSATVSFLQVSQYARIFLHCVRCCRGSTTRLIGLRWFGGAQNQKTLVEAFISYNNQVFSCLVSSFQKNINFRHHTFQCFFVLLFAPLFANKLDCMQMQLLRMPQQHATS